MVNIQTLIYLVYFKKGQYFVMNYKIDCGLKLQHCSILLTSNSTILKKGGGGTVPISR